VPSGSALGLACGPPATPATPEASKPTFSFFAAANAAQEFASAHWGEGATAEVAHEAALAAQRTSDAWMQRALSAVDVAAFRVQLEDRRAAAEDRWRCSASAAADTSDKPRPHLCSRRAAEEYAATQEAQERPSRTNTDQVAVAPRARQARAPLPPAVPARQSRPRQAKQAQRQYPGTTLAAKQHGAAMPQSLRRGQRMGAGP
jgi:hypothetical protein